MMNLFTLVSFCHIFVVHIVCWKYIIVEIDAEISAKPASQPSRD